MSKKAALLAVAVFATAAASAAQCTNWVYQDANPAIHGCPFTAPNGDQMIKWDTGQIELVLPAEPIMSAPKQIGVLPPTPPGPYANCAGISDSRNYNACIAYYSREATAKAWSRWAR